MTENEVAPFGIQQEQVVAHMCNSEYDVISLWYLKYLTPYLLMRVRGALYV